MNLKNYLNKQVTIFNQLSFIEKDPISIPHGYTNPRDIEIAGIFAATLAWGQRKTIINKCRLLMNMMDNVPYEFVRYHEENDLKPFERFCHRTFNGTDTLYFIHFLRHLYQHYTTMEDAFIQHIPTGATTIEEGLNGFRNFFISLPEFPGRTGKHVAAPERKSACKRLNMFLRWMVRKDGSGVDFGIWQKIKPSQLICPCDVHVSKVGRRLGLITRKNDDWFTAIELTENLRKYDPEDPVKYDFALFGMGVG